MGSSAGPRLWTRRRLLPRAEKPVYRTLRSPKKKTRKRLFERQPTSLHPAERVLHTGLGGRGLGAEGPAAETRTVLAPCAISR